MKEIIGIYKIQNLVNYKKYYGQAVDVERRLNQHKRNLINNNHSNEHLQNSVQKYGIENFIFEVVGEVDEENLDYVERWLIQSNNTNNRKYGYNKDDGGHENHRPNEETRQKMRENHWDCSGENHPMYGKHHTPEAREKVSRNHADVSGENNPMYGKDMSGSKNGMYNPNYDDDEIIELAEKGYSTRDISKIIGANSSTIQKRLYNTKGKEWYENYISNTRSYAQKFKNTAKRKYDKFWDVTCVKYDKSTMIRNNRTPNPCVCFYLKYNSKTVKIGGFIEFYSIEIINNLINEYS